MRAGDWNGIRSAFSRAITIWKVDKAACLAASSGRIDELKELQGTKLKIINN